MRLYFAYGSNMSKAVMARHAPDAVPVGVAKRDHWRFIISRSGYGSIEPSPGSMVYGVLWNVSDRDLVGLDAYENVSTGLYHRRDLKVSYNDQPVQALTYIVVQPGTGRPEPGYIPLVLEAARDWGLPNHYLIEIVRWVDPEQAMTNTAIHVIIHGRVQGVGYRAWAEHKATQRGLSGWVRNRREGSVEAVFAGPAEEVTAMIQDCSKGPRSASVDRVEQRHADEIERPQAGTSFEQRPTV